MTQQFVCPECGLKDGLMMEQYHTVVRVHITGVISGKLDLDGDGGEQFIPNEPEAKFYCGHCGWVVCETDDITEAISTVQEHFVNVTA